MPWWRLSLSIILFRVLALCAQGADRGVIQFELAEFTVLENGTNATIGIVRTSGSDGTVTVDFGTTGGNAVAGLDYLPTSGTAVFEPGEVRQTFRVGLIDDFDPSTNRTVQLVLSNVLGGASLGVPSTATLVIEENDAVIEFAADHYSVAENGGTVIVSAIRRFGTNDDMTVGYFTTAGSATAGQDYQRASGSLTFEAGDTNKAITLSVIDDALVELAETFRVHLTNPVPFGSAFLGSPSNTTIRIVDDEFAPGIVGFARTNFNVFENSRFATVTLARTNGYSGTVSVDFQTVAATVPAAATSNVDFVLTNGTVVFADGEASKTISLEIIDDQLLEPVNEVFSVHLAASSGGAFIGLSNATVSIIEDDAPGVVQFSTNQVWVNESVGQASISVVRLGGSAGSMSVDYFTTTNVGLTNIPAVEVRDYLQAVGTLFFGPGETSRNVTITIFDDAEVELARKTIGLRLANAVVGSLGFVVESVIHVSDDDVAFEFAAEHFSVSEGATNAVVTVKRTGNSNVTATVDFVANSGIEVVVTITNSFTTNLIINSQHIVIGTNIVPNTALQTNSVAASNGVHFTGVATTLHFPAGLVFTNVSIPVLDDRMVDFDRSIALRLTNPKAAGVSLGTMSNATATVSENDSAFALRIGLTNTASTTIAESEGSLRTFVTGQVIRYGNNTEDVEVTVGLAPSTATVGLDFLNPTRTFTFTNGQQSAFFPVEIFGDSLPEADEVIGLRLANATPTNVASIGPADVLVPMIATNTTGEITIIDNDARIEFLLPTNVVRETDGTVFVDVKREGGLSFTSQVDLLARDLGASSDSDYGLSHRFVNFNPGVTNLSIPLQITNDLREEGLESFELILSSAVSGPPGANMMIGPVSNTVVEIQDSPGGIMMWFENSKVNESAGQVVIYMSRFFGAGGTVSGELLVTDGTASSRSGSTGGDYEGAGIHAFSWNDGEFGGIDIALSLYNDQRLETDETIYAVLTNVTGSSGFDRTPRTVVILDDDGRAGSDDDFLGAVPGFNDTVHAIAEQSNGQLIVGGAFNFHSAIYRSRVARLNQDGMLDQSFNDGDGPNNHVFSVAVQEDGGVLIGGDFTAVAQTPANRLARFLPDGVFDSSFDVGTGADGRVRAIAPLPDGKILVGGEFSRFGISGSTGLARLHANGLADTSFLSGLGVQGQVNALYVYPTNTTHAGKILIGGSFSNYNGTPILNLARLNEDGSLDHTFGTVARPDGAVNAITVHPNGCIIIGGAFTRVQGAIRPRLTALDSEGNLLNAFGIPVLNEPVTSVAVDSLGGIWAGGKFTSNFDLTVNRIVRFDTNGVVDSQFVGSDRGTDGTVNALLITADQRVVFGGEFLSVNQRPQERIARYNGTRRLQTPVRLEIRSDAQHDFQFHVTAEPGRILRFQETTDFRMWTDAFTEFTRQGAISFERSILVSPSRRFYRAFLIDE